MKRIEQDVKLEEESREGANDVDGEKEKDTVERL